MSLFRVPRLAIEPEVRQGQASASHIYHLQERDLSSSPDQLKGLRPFSD